jgi:hypothetical protein
MLRHTRPGERGSMFQRTDLGGAHGRVGQRPHRDRIAGREPYHRSGFRPDCHQRFDGQQVADRVGQRR